MSNDVSDDACMHVFASPEVQQSNWNPFVQDMFNMTASPMLPSSANTSATLSYGDITLSSASLNASAKVSSQFDSLAVKHNTQAISPAADLTTAPQSAISCYDGEATGHAIMEACLALEAYNNSTSRDAPKEEAQYPEEPESHFAQMLHYGDQHQPLPLQFHPSPNCDASYRNFGESQTLLPQQNFPQTNPFPAAIQPQQVHLPPATALAFTAAPWAFCTHHPQDIPRPPLSPLPVNQQDVPYIMPLPVAHTPMKHKKSRNKARKWSDMEQARFEFALETWGRDWEAIARHVGTRSPSSVRSHSQKYLIKLYKTGQPLPARVLESGAGYTLSGNPLRDDSPSARSYLTGLDRQGQRGVCAGAGTHAGTRMSTEGGQSGFKDRTRKESACTSCGVRRDGF